MSLDVSLYTPKPIKQICSCCDSEYEARELLFDANITHNLNKMAEEAGFYQELWHGVNVEFAKDLVNPISKGLQDMKARPDHYKQFNAANGWGTYEQFIPWLETYLDACKEHPNAVIYVSR